MFYYLTGTLVMTEPNAAALDVGGVAYRLTISGGTLSKIAGKTENVRLYTYLKVQEDAVELFGFADEEELDTFKLLIGVSGVGPKAAISILTALPPQPLAQAVLHEDIRAISRANGVGTKTAARIVLELKDKMHPTSTDAESSRTVGEHRDSGKLNEAVNALLVLGFSKQDAVSALQKIDTSARSLEQCVTEALRVLTRL